MRLDVVSLAIWLAVASALACGGSGGEKSESTGGESSAASSSAETAGDACAEFSKSEIEAVVGNPVLEGEHYAGSEVCRWDTENPDQVSVLLTVRPKGGIREPVLCDGLRQGGEGERLSGIGEIAFFKFSAVGTMFNSGDLEACGPRGFVGVSLNGKADEATLKKAAVEIVTRVMGR